MTKKNVIKLIFILLTMSNGLLYGQQTRIELGDKYFDQFAYKKAMKLYEGAIDRNHKNWDNYAKLGDCYYYTSKPEKAIENYRIALQKKSNNMDNYRLKYALSMLSVNNCNTVIDKLKKSKDSLTIKVIWKYFGLKIESNKIPDDFQSKICQKNDNPKSEIKIENLAINSVNSDFGGFIYNDTLYFASSRENPAKKRRLNKRIYKWNDQPYLDIYEAIIIENSDSNYLKLVSPDSSKIGINTVAHEAAITITNDGKTMYFSGGEVNKRNKLKYNKRGTSSLKLQRASLVNNKWVVTDADKKAMKFFDFENYSIGSPALSPDNKRLFFVSCAPFLKAQGQTDIYYSNIKDDGSFDSIVNLGEKINTQGREMFPFISENNILYFSSDGVYDDNNPMGLLDIYKYDLNEKNKEGNVVITLGEPYNSRKDDFAYFVRSLPDNSTYSEQGYFSSNRDTFFQMGDTIIPKGDDDIYSFNVKCKQTIQGSITDLKTGDYLEDATVELIDSNGMVLKNVQVDSTGVYSFDVECDQFYRLRGSMTRYYDDLKESNYTEARDNINLILKPYPCQITVNHLYKSDSIRFDRINKKDLLPILELLLTNPDIKIRIESHTDSRGSAEYNLDLSERRAQASKSYLIKVGVKESQITSAKGFGKDCLLKSDEEIKNLPTEKEKKHAHNENRRSQFIIKDCKDDSEGCQDIPGG